MLLGPQLECQWSTKSKSLKTSQGFRQKVRRLSSSFLAGGASSCLVNNKVVA